ncbi:DUF692 domain-containing protein [Hyphobacterium sp. SN044]|uniref:MNIO family bufferin maturase n=1 Tax=Hyphobacterium sp. SN044 TaxID=2912575 RepID=UPI001F232345|nr:DUF692 domain-containing protein [Hyphobacterium sp. SN044]MCF8880195.1 DUF692 domain-containing protein [Hyphobacterium sp. SN044]
MITSTRLPPRAMGAGLGLKPAHYRAVLESDAPGLWVEVHPENYMLPGGPRLHWLEAIAQRHPVSLHGVSLSLGGADRPDPDHLKSLRELIDRYRPALVSEHLAWCRHDGIYYGDLLPLPYTAGALDRFCDHVDEVQDALGRSILIENPSLYVDLKGDMTETEFLVEAVRRTGCGLLLDLNNVFVTAINLKRDALGYLETFPLDAVGEIHLAGHETDPDGSLLIDTHGAPVADAVWSLYRETIARTGPVPTLIERDNNLPPFVELMAERERAQALLEYADEAALADA